jgi:hypothetical protein
MWINPSQSLITAEQEMENIKVLSLMGVIAF